MKFQLGLQNRLPLPSHHRTTSFLFIGLFALFLVAGSACTKVHVSVYQAAPSSGLTGTHCKLQRELKNQHQQTNVWCWAASAHTVLEYLRNEEIQQRDTCRRSSVVS